MTDFEEKDGFEEEISEEKAENVTETNETNGDASAEMYGVSYSPTEHGVYNNAYYGGDFRSPRYEVAEPKKKSGGGKIALISVIAVVCILFSFCAGAFGSYLVSRLQMPVETVTPSGNKPSGDFRPDGDIVVKHVEVDSSSYSTPFTETVARVKDSVVEIYTESVIYYGRTSYIQSGAGSGVIFSHDNSHYYIVTNNHVIENAKTITVRTTDGTEYTAALYATDELSDLAIVAIEVPDGKTLTEAQLANVSGELVDGQDVFVIGNPLGLLGGSVAKGIIGKTERVIKIDGIQMTLIQLDVAVNPGNSGGGLFDMAGNLIGIVNAKSTGDTVDGLGYAIPCSTVIKVCDDLLKQKYVSGRVSLGMNLTDDVQSSVWSSETYCTVAGTTSVTGTEDGKEFAFASGDIIYAVDGEEISNTLSLYGLLNSKYKVGDTVTLTVYRGERIGSYYSSTIRYNPHSVKVTLVEYTP